MRLAVLSDIHGNLEALGAVLAHAEGLHVDGFIVVGDVVVGAADSLACWERVRALGCPVLRGNHEGYVARFSDPDAPSLWRTEQFAPVAWAVDQLGDTACRTLGALPFSLTLPEVPEALFVHASLRSDRDNLDAYTPEGELAEMFPGLRARYVLRGHDHHAAIRAWRGHQLTTNGSVGIPLNGRTEAQYLTVDLGSDGPHFTFHAVPYDVAGALERFEKTGYLEEAGPMAALFYREIATASPHLIPFLRGYARYSQGGRLGLGDAVRAFLQFGSP